MTTTKKRANWRTPDATRVDIDEHADRLAWLKERRNGIGGTDAAALMGVHISLSMSTAVDVTPGDIFLDKTSTHEPVEDDKAIFAFGHLLEPTLARKAEDRWGITTRPGGFYRSKKEPFLYANPDFLASDGGIVEGKSASNRSKAAPKWLAGDISEHAYIQTQHYLAVTGRTHSYYSVAIRDDYSGWESVPRHLWTEPWFADLAVKEFVQVGPVERNDAVIEEMLAIEREFWAAVQEGVMPEHIAASLTATQRHPVAVKDLEVEPAIPEMAADDIARLDTLRRQIKEFVAEKAAIEDRIKSEIGSAEYLVINGARRARWRSIAKTDFDKKSLAADHPDLVEKYTTRGTQRRLEILGAEA